MGHSTEEEYNTFIEIKNEYEVTGGCSEVITAAIPHATIKNEYEVTGECSEVITEAIPHATTKIKVKKCKTLHKCHYDGCDKSFWKPSRLLWHIRQHTGEKPYKCTFANCNRAYTTSSHLKRHIGTHNIVQQSIKCNICQLTLKSRDNYRKHYQRVHGNVNRMCCNECSIVFRKKHKFDEHMAIHNKLSLFPCEKCDKVFVTSYLLKKHTNATHNKILKCTENNCNAQFYRFIDLRVHEKSVHPKEYKCNECGKCFSNKYSLRPHIKAHNNPSLLSCPYEECNKVYSFQRNLQQHIRSQHLGKVFYCDMCGKGVLSKQTIIRHIRKMHLCEELKTKKQPKRGAERRQRKDTGLPRKSMVTKLVGVDLPLDVEKKILSRIPAVKSSDCKWK